MSIINRRSASDLRGVLRLAVEATVGVTDLVEKVHHTIQLGHPPVGVSRANNTTGLTGLIYRGIRGTTRLVGQGLDAGLAPAVALLPESASNDTRDVLIAAINGVYGDHLLETGNPLATRMSFRDQGSPDSARQAEVVSAISTRATPDGKLMLFIHGLGLNENHWTREDKNLAETLANDLGYSPLYLRYNTGLPVADNGRELAEMLEDLLQNRQDPVTELVIIGYSMGGLVARSACHHGLEAGHHWLSYLRKMVFMGTPHHGAPLEKGGDWLNYAMDLSPYSAPFTRIGNKRSAGIADLRHGTISNSPSGFVQLPADVQCYAIAGTLAKKRGPIHDRLIGDGLVPVDSALGQKTDPERSLSIPKEHQWLVFETGHLALLGSAGAFEKMQDWLG